jgi:tetratricopeptide (TPR) repeat protein
LRAWWLSWLGVTLSQTGHRAEALPPTQEAVAIRRELAEAYPDRYRPGVAASLSNLGVCFYELGRAAEALPSAQEAVAIYRELTAAYPDRYRPDLARSLQVLAIALHGLGRWAEARATRREADHNGGGTVRFPRLRRRLGLRHRNPNSPR